jgi:hypothetical protein
VNEKRFNNRLSIGKGDEKMKSYRPKTDGLKMTKLHASAIKKKKNTHLCT